MTARAMKMPSLKNRSVSANSTATPSDAPKAQAAKRPESKKGCVKSFEQLKDLVDA